MMLLGMPFDAQSSTCAPLMYNWECGIDLSGAPLPSPSKSAKSIDIGHQRTLIVRVAVSRVTASSLRRMPFARRTNYVRFNHALQSENIG
jgi:hypothetical protein